MITIRGLQSPKEGEEEVIETVVKGVYTVEDTVHILRYEEVIEENQETIYNELYMTPKRLEVRKNGAVNTVMVLEEHKTNETRYETPYGSLLFTMVADTSEWTVESDAIKVSVPYRLEANAELIANCRITIEAYFAPVFS